MKIMEVPLEDDCHIDIVIPQKKMKQARLPFQILSSAESSNTLSAKKRKLDSSTASESRSPKIMKVTTKENSAKKIEKLGSGVSDVDDKLDEMNVDNGAVESRKLEDVQKVDEVVGDKGPTRSRSKREKGEKMNVKNEVKHGALTAFLKRIESKQEDDDDSRIILESECKSGSSKSDNSTLKVKMDSKPKETIVKSLNIDDEGTSSNESVVSNEIDAENCESSVIKFDDTNKKRSITKLRTLDGKDSLYNKEKLNLIANESDVVTSNSETGSDNLSSDSDVGEEQEKSKSCAEEKDKTVDEKCSEKMSKSEKAGGSAIKNRKLTPKQLEKRMESAKKLEYRKRLEMEKEKKREERENRRKEKEEKRKEKEEKERAEKEQKRKEKELKELKKQMEIEQKQKEKEAKEEDRRKRDEVREEERRKKEEEKLEAERKKQKAASNFASFFVAKKQESKPMDKDNAKVKNFMPFEVKADMRVAPVCRRHLSEHQKLRLDESCGKEIEEKGELYLEEIKSKGKEIGKSKRTWPVESKDVIIIEEDDDGSCNLVDNVTIEKQRAKLLMFAENRRPPYWGTWRKKSNCVKPRKPFSRDVKWFDYEVDSDEEWEEEEPGESIRGSDDERDEENLDDNEYDIDNEFMVPHGYLSDEEARADEEDTENMSPETQKVKLKLLGEEFEAERNTKTSKIKPKVIGCIWQGPVNSYGANITPHLVQFLMSRQAWVRETPILLGPVAGNDNTNEWRTLSQGQQVVRTTPGSKKTKVPVEAIPNLIRLIHGNTHGKVFLVKEFMAFWNRENNGTSQISKASLSQKIRELGKWMSCPEEGPMHLRACWYVAEDTRRDNGCREIELPNRWSYTLKPKRKSEVEVVEKPEREKKEEEDKKNKKKKVPLITQFTKKMTQKEMQKQLTVKSPQVVFTKMTPPVNKPPKRVALISVGRGEQFPKSSRDRLLDQCASGVTVEKEKEKESGEEKWCDNSDEIMIVGEVVRSLPGDETRVDKKSGDGFDSVDGKMAIGTSSCGKDSKNEKSEDASTKEDRSKDVLVVEGSEKNVEMHTA